MFSGENHCASFTQFYFLDPDLVYSKCVEGADGFEGALDLLPRGYNPRKVQPDLSGQLCYSYSLVLK